MFLRFEGGRIEVGRDDVQVNMSDEEKNPEPEGMRVIEPNPIQ